MKSLSLTKPHLIAMVGLPGSGKSYFANAFADTFHAPYISTSAIAKFSPEHSNELSLHLLEECLKTNQSVIFDGATDTYAERGEVSKRAKKAGYEVLFVWIQTDEATARNRMTHPKLREQPLTDEQFDKRLKRFKQPTSLERSLVLSGKHTYASQAKIVLKKLSSPRAETPATPPERPQQRGARNIIIR